MSSVLAPVSSTTRFARERRRESVPPELNEASEPHDHLDLTNVVPGRWQRAGFAAENEALVSIKSNRGRVPLAHVQEQAIQPLSPGPMDDGVNQGRANALAPCRRRHPHGGQLANVPDPS